jgi:hypothetical protein
MDVYYGVPRLHPNDSQLLTHPLIDNEFRQHTRNSRDMQWMAELAGKLFSDISWVPIIHNWVNYCIGIDLPDIEGSRLFVEVLWLRSQSNYDEALRLLLKKQVAAIQVCRVMIWHQFVLNPTGCDGV